MNIKLKPTIPPKIVEFIGEGDILTHVVLDNGETVTAEEVTSDQWEMAGITLNPISTH